MVGKKSVAILAYWYFLERRDVGFARVCFQALRYFQAFIFDIFRLRAELNLLSGASGTL